jgi:hypothetical protein
MDIATLKYAEKAYQKKQNVNDPAAKLAALMGHRSWLTYLVHFHGADALLCCAGCDRRPRDDFAWKIDARMLPKDVDPLPLNNQAEIISVINPIRCVIVPVAFVIRFMIPAKLFHFHVDYLALPVLVLDYCNASRSLFEFFFPFPPQ